MSYILSYIKIIFLSTGVLLTLSLVHAQEKVDMERVKPKRFFDKWELLAGPGITFPNGRNIITSVNPRITAGFLAMTGYFVGIGVIHSMGNFELRTRFFWEQRGNVQKLWDNEPSGLFELTNEMKSNFYTVGITPTLFPCRTKRFHVFAGVSYSRLSSTESMQTLTLNGQIQSIHRLQYSVGQAGLQGNVWDATCGIGYIVYAKAKKEISVLLQNEYDVTDAINANGTVIRNNTLRLGVHFKFFR